MVFNKYRNGHANVIAVEGGGWAQGQSESQKFQSLFVARMMGKLGYDVVNVGPSDLLYGVETLEETAKDAGFKLVSSNILRKSNGKHYFDPYVIDEFGGVKVGFLGVVAENEAIATVNPDDDDFTVANVESTLTDLIPQVRKKADVVIVFTHLGARRSQKLVDEVKGIDVAINGNDPMVSSKPFEVGGDGMAHSLVCSGGDRGKYLGALTLIVSDKGKILRWTHELHGLDKNVPEDSTMKAEVEEFKEQLREVKKREVVEQVVGPQSSNGPTEKYLGANICRRCHEAAFASWEASPHARSLASLEGKSMENASQCLQCHVTGHGEANGFTLNKVDLGKVSCEQCHGHGTMHGEPGFIAHPTAESCTVCHDKKNSPHFDYAKYWKEIAH